MKAILEFNLPEDKVDHYHAINGINYSLVLWDLDQWLRGIIKYNPDGYSGKEIETYQRVRDKLNTLMDDYNVTYEP